MGERLTGHVRHLGGERWELVANLPPDNGKRRRASKRITIKGVRRAEGALSDWITRLEQHACTDPDTLTLGELFERWLVHAPETAGPKQMEAYRARVKDHIAPGLGHRVVSELTHAELSAWYRQKMESGRKDGTGGLSTQTVRNLHATIRTALTWAVDNDIVDKNPAQRVKHPPKQGKRKVSVWDEATQARAVAEARGMAVYVPCALAGWAGLRRGEVCALRWENVHLDVPAIAVRESVQEADHELYYGESKTEAGQRLKPIPRQLAELLREHKRAQDELRLKRGGGWNSGGFVCCRSDGQPMRPNTLSTNWAAFVRSRGLPRIEFHGLRRSYASRMHAAGARDALTMNWMGHTDIRTTHRHYIVVLTDEELAFIAGEEERIAAAVGETGRRGVVKMEREVTG